MSKLILVITLTIIFNNNFIAQDTTYYCNDLAQILIGSYLIENNVWGKGNITNYTQCVYETTNKEFGWNW
ncbi:MAG: hypothetical protein ACW99A_12855, partial [Candidatus Kariarchaeaceae archaeon]